ncbi:EGF-like repeat and discoidin I-like domain-containing protein 3 [Montipora capricornis]|uniref:EGF-like repeat and discoidin I-like domain-containing protein 3 n=1 Tax=Montipora capricornis TaxID=246305 RepID=UPI0035F14FC0
MSKYFELILVDIILFSSGYLSIATCSSQCRTSFSNKNYVLVGHVIQTLKSTTFEKCTFSCEMDSRCFSVNYFAWHKTCELNNASSDSSPDHLVPRKGALSMDMVIRKHRTCASMRCENGGTCVPSPREHCKCFLGFSGFRCEILQGALGMESGAIPNNNISAFSEKPGYNAWKGRLHGSECWMAEENNRNQYITVSFTSEKTVNVIATHGAPNDECWVTSYRIQWWWSDGSSHSDETAYQANQDKNTVVYNTLTSPIKAKLVRIFPLNWHSCIAMRLELYGY